MTPPFARVERQPAFLTLGPNAEHLDSLADNRVPVADVGSLAVFALQVVAAIGVGAITSAPLRGQ